MKRAKVHRMAAPSVAVVALMAFSNPAWAQQSTAQTAENPPQGKPSTDTGELEEIIVTGARAALGSAQAIKRNADQIVDSVQAEDIGKLPDANTIEALQRITGVQIQRRYGEGATDFDHRTQPAVTVRGLTQTLNLMDGRAVFSAAGSRSFDLEGIPPELLAGIDVYKNPPASMIEGGVGGAINLRTRLPFDAPDQIVSATVKGNYYDRADKFGGSASALYSDREQTGVGEMGFLLNAVYGKSDYRQDAILVGQQAAVPAGVIANAPSNAKVPLGLQIYDDNGDRERIGVAGAYQWRINSDLMVTSQVQYTKYKFDRTGAYYYPIDNSSTPAPTPGAAFTFGSDGYATSGSISNQIFEAGRFDQALDTDSTNATFNVSWATTSHLTMKFDAQYMKSRYDADRNGLVLSLHQKTGETGFTGPNQSIIDFDLRGDTPVWNVRNPALLTNVSNYTVPFIADSLTRNDADQTALAYDVDYDNSGSFFNRLRAGARYTDSNITLRGTWNGVCLYRNAADPSCSAPDGTPLPPLSQYPQLFKSGPSANFFDGRTLPGGVLYPEFLPGSGLWNSLGSTYALLGAQRKLSFSPADITTLNEKTVAGYVTADYETELIGMPVDGNVGVRLAQTKLTSTGTQFNANGTTQQIATDKSYLSPLPSFNIRFRPTDEFQIRGAYSKAITRPNFDQLSTNLTLNAANQINPLTGRPSASQGNPNLDPIKSDNYDLTAEWYFSSTGSLTAGLFYKETNGFIFGDNVVRTYDGRAYDTATSANAGGGSIKGFEVAYQQFFDFLPGLFSGLGFQANYTYAYSAVDFTTHDASGNPITTLRPLEKLSRHSYNLVGLYEKGPVSARLAWNWRGPYFDTTTGSGANGTMQYQKAYSTLDASVSVDLSRHVAVTVDAVNLTNSMSVTYIDTPGQPLQYTLNDRRFGISVRATY
ncbi:TonB-dependent receptor [Nitrospirillum pindoramense]|uniref:TonB-dependent receptor n=1 Tax=Nitrospirillum amazonense TaxID=28077 RepID=A0A560GR60_9PROT|nr:TonB-dependent receptor [Nitrospirillum amazonense]TWB36513.1 TonB-dependent receptor [Nitrospirillum amazonense]